MEFILKDYTTDANREILEKDRIEKIFHIKSWKSENFLWESNLISSLQIKWDYSAPVGVATDLLTKQI